MRKTISARRRGRAPLALGMLAVALGAACGTLLVAATAGAHDPAAPPDRDPATILDATHVPPLLTVPGEPVTLRYDVICAAPGDDPFSGAPCDAGGRVYLREGDAGPFTPVELDRADTYVEGGRYSVKVPAQLVDSRVGFSYYAVLHSDRGAAMTVPSGGADAPQRVLPLADAVTVQLGAHSFGAARRPDDRVVDASWGTGSGQVGLSEVPGATRIGPSSFDVDAAGVVTVLDQINGRALEYSRGRGVRTIPLDVVPAIDDLSVGVDGSLHVLETSAPGSMRPVVKSFDPTGRLLTRVAVAERTASQVRTGPHGPIVRQYPAEEWMPVVADGRPLDAVAQARAGRPARTFPDRSTVVVLRTGNEVRVASTTPAGVRLAWRVTSATPLAEVQLAEPLGSKLVLVVRVFTDDRDEFLALVLGRRGLERQFAIASQGWAETAPLTRFRLAGESLYQLGSTSAGAQIDRFDLEVAR
jgi:hypothetical protein